VLFAEQDKWSKKHFFRLYFKIKINNSNAILKFYFLSNQKIYLFPHHQSRPTNSTIKPKVK